MKRILIVAGCIILTLLPAAADGLSPVSAALYAPAPAVRPEALKATGTLHAGETTARVTSRSRRYTYWTVMSLGIAFGIGGLVNAASAGDAYDKYQSATISYEAQRLGDRMERINRKSLEQLSLSAFFTVIATMMSMDVRYGE